MPSGVGTWVGDGTRAAGGISRAYISGRDVASQALPYATRVAGSRPPGPAELFALNLWACDALVTLLLHTVPVNVL